MQKTPLHLFCTYNCVFGVSTNSQSAGSHVTSLYSLAEQRAGPPYCWFFFFCYSVATLARCHVKVYRLKLIST